MFKLVFLCLLFPFLTLSQKSISEEYIYKYKDISMKEMYENNIPASIILAQSIIESNFGRSKLAVNGNNYFGIKCHGWSGFRYEKNKYKLNHHLLYLLNQ